MVLGRQPQVDLLLLRGGLQLVQPDRPVRLAQRVLCDAPELLFMFSDPSLHNICVFGPKIDVVKARIIIHLQLNNIYAILRGSTGRVHV